MKRVLMECSLFYVETSPKTIKLLIVNDTLNTYSLVEADSKSIIELDPTILSNKLMDSLVYGLDHNSYKKVENTYEL